MMKNYPAVVLAVICMMMFTSCPQDEEDPYDPIDSQLKGSWSNEAVGENKGNDKRTFDIQANGNFTARINPAGQGWGTVRGKLVRKDGDYLMININGTTDDNPPGWGSSAGSITKGKFCQMTFYDNDKFNFGSIGNSIIVDFFGGDYYRQPAP